MPDNFTSVHRKLIISLAAQFRIPTIYPYRYFAEEGGLLSAGVNTSDLFRRAAEYVSRILRGEVQATARTLGLEVATYEIRRAEDIAPVFEALNSQADALYVVEDALVAANVGRIVTLALSARLPTVFNTREFVQAGGLMSYGPDYPALFRRAGDYDASVFLYAFDLIELSGDDLRREPLEVRKATLKSVLAKAGPGLRLNEHIEADGPPVFAHACKMGLEGIVSKHKASTYRSGRSPDWLKCKNPACEAVKREAEGDWGW
jgi:hypothetical protein